LKGDPRNGSYKQKRKGAYMQKTQGGWVKKKGSEHRKGRGANSKKTRAQWLDSPRKPVITKKKTVKRTKKRKAKIRSNLSNISRIEELVLGQPKGRRRKKAGEGIRESVNPTFARTKYQILFQ